MITYTVVTTLFRDKHRSKNHAFTIIMRCNIMNIILKLNWWLTIREILITAASSSCSVKTTHTKVLHICTI